MKSFSISVSKRSEFKVKKYVVVFHGPFSEPEFIEANPFLLHRVLSFVKDGFSTALFGSWFWIVHILHVCVYLIFVADYAHIFGRSANLREDILLSMCVVNKKYFLRVTYFQGN